MRATLRPILLAALVTGACTPLARGLPDASADLPTADAASVDAARPDAMTADAADVAQAVDADAPPPRDVALDVAPVDGADAPVVIDVSDAALDLAPGDVVGDGPSGDARDVAASPDALDASAPPDAPADAPADAPDAPAACVPTERARPLGPASGSRVTTRRPLLRWALPAGADGATIELCRDRDCSGALLGSFAASGGSARVSDPAPLARATVWWRVRPTRAGAPCGAASVSWALWPARRDVGEGQPWRPVPDFNGDGRADAAIGAHRALGGGRVHVHLGQVGGLATTLSQAISPPSGTTEFGNVVTGDFNGDGLTDLAASTFLMSGGPAWAFSSDGARLQAPVQLQQPTDSGTYFGLSLHAGDVNGDGYTDLVVPTGHQTSDARGGRVLVYYGGPRGLAPNPATTITGTSAGGVMLAAAAAVLDVDDDGDDDVVATLNEDARRGLRVLAGSPAGLQSSAGLVATVAGRSFPGAAPVVLGDVSGDGRVDFGFFDRGVTPQRIHVVTRVVAEQIDAEGFSVVPSDEPSGLRSLVGADLTGDGRSDLVVSQDVTGGARLYLYPASGSALGAPQVFAPAAGEPGFGTGLALTVGDHDGDGFEDLLWAQSAFAGGNGAWATWPGAAGAPAMSGRRVVTGAEAGAGLGIRVACFRGSRARRTL